jgi:hypothetical protein
MITESDLRPPPVSKEILEWLERLFPDRAPDLKHSTDEIRFRSGQVSVVRKLRSEYEAQTKNALESTA